MKQSIFLSRIFRERSPLFNTCWQYVSLVKNMKISSPTLESLTGNEKFKLNELIPDLFECLFFDIGLTATKDVDINSCILTKLE